MPYSGKSCDSPRETAVFLRCRKPHPGERIFFFDQRKDRGIFIGRVDISHANKSLEKINHKRKREVIQHEQLAILHSILLCLQN